MSMQIEQQFTIEKLHLEMINEVEFLEESIPRYQVYTEEDLKAMWEAYEESLYE